MSELPVKDGIEPDQTSLVIDWDPAFADQVLRSVEITNQVNRSVWSMTIYQGEAILNIGNTNFVTDNGRGILRFIVDQGVVHDDQRELFETLRTADEFKSNPSFAVLKIPSGNADQVFEAFASAHEAAIRHTAAYWKINQRWRWHLDDLRLQLQSQTGSEIPEPGYLHDIPALAQSENRTLDEKESFTLEHIDGRRYWKVSAGTQDKYWGDMLRLGRIHHENWAADPILLDQLPSDYDAFVRDITQHAGIAKPAADHCWRFMQEMKPGDLAAAIERDRSLGWAEITGDYEYVNGDALPQHQRSAAWTELPPYRIPNMSKGLKDEIWGIGPRELSPLHFAEAVGAMMVGYEPTSNRASEASDLFATMQPEVIKRLARDIRIAHEINGNSWALMRIQQTSARPGIVMFVGQQNTSWVRADGGGWLFYGSPDEPLFEHLDRTSMRTDYAPSIFWIRSSSPDGLATLAESNSDAHDRAIEYLAGNVRTRTGRASQHEAQTREALEATLGEELPRPDYEAIVKSSNIDPLSATRNHFAASGLHYTDAQIATFYTSLQTKGFVVLSGISGTGKSKIATGFVEMLPQSAAPSSRPLEVAVADDQLAFQVRPYMRQRHRVTFAKRYVDMFPEFTQSVGQKIPVSIDAQTGTGYLWYRVHNGQPEVTVRMHKSLYDAAEQWVLDETMVAELDIDEDTEAVKAVRFFRPEPDHAVATEAAEQPNHLFLSVRPDWRDSTSLLGYYNPLTQTYEWTEFLHFLIRAQESYKVKDGLAWFVILDEMNLAHVEYYFADLLSVIESGRDDEGWTREPLRMTYPDMLDDDVPPHELKLPPNLYIIGTVNMDETTHAFSPKVLDRAFTIELADVSFEHYPIASASSDVVMLSDSDKDALLQAFTREGRFALIDKGEIGTVVVEHPRIRTDLQALNTLLQPHRMHFGYRVFDEIAQYLHNNDINGMMPFEDAFDQAVFMKVLPKFTGSRARLQSPLHGVLAWAIDPASTSRDDVGAAIVRFNAFYSGTAVEAWTVEPVFSVVAARVRDMLVALERDGFVSFG